MKVTRKEATITSTSDADEFPGTFEVVLSAPTLDRDGDTLLPDEWKDPLPDHITFDVDHGMSVASTVGSGVPHIDEKTGNLVVNGTFSSLPRAQEVRTLVNEGHIRTTSVAFMTEKQRTKDGKSRSVRELLNGAFVAIPSNREAVILSSKGVEGAELKYSPDQERDDHGRFASGSGGSRFGTLPAPIDSYTNQQDWARGPVDVNVNGAQAMGAINSMRNVADRAERAGSHPASVAAARQHLDNAESAHRAGNADAAKESFDKAHNELSYGATLGVSAGDSASIAGYAQSAARDHSLAYGYNDPSSKKSLTGVELKYSPDQERDDHGRFAGAGMSDTNGNGYHAAAQAALNGLSDHIASRDDLTEEQRAAAAEHLDTAQNHLTQARHDAARGDSESAFGSLARAGAAAREAEVAIGNRGTFAGRDAGWSETPAGIGSQEISAVAGQFHNAFNVTNVPYGDAKKSVSDATLKYSPDQERDDHGRFASGGVPDYSHPLVNALATEQNNMVNAIGSAESAIRDAIASAPTEQAQKDAVKALDHIVTAYGSHHAAMTSLGNGNPEMANFHMGEAALNMQSAKDLYNSSTSRDLTDPHPQWYSDAYYAGAFHNDALFEAQNAGGKKSLFLKYSPDQERDDHGRFAGSGYNPADYASSTGFGTEYRTGTGGVDIHAANDAMQRIAGTAAYVQSRAEPGSSAHSAASRALDKLNQAQALHGEGSHYPAGQLVDSAKMNTIGAISEVRGNDSSHPEYEKYNNQISSLHADMTDYLRANGQYVNTSYASQLLGGKKALSADVKDLLAELQGVTTAKSADTVDTAAANAATVDTKSADEVAVEALAIKLIAQGLS